MGVMGRMRSGMVVVARWIRVDGVVVGGGWEGCLRE